MAGVVKCVRIADLSHGIKSALGLGIVILNINRALKLRVENGYQNVRVATSVSKQ